MEREEKLRETKSCVLIKCKIKSACGGISCHEERPCLILRFLVFLLFIYLSFLFFSDFFFFSCFFFLPLSLFLSLSLSLSLQFDAVNECVALYLDVVNVFVRIVVALLENKPAEKKKRTDAQ